MGNLQNETLFINQDFWFFSLLSGKHPTSLMGPISYNPIGFKVDT